MAVRLTSTSAPFRMHITRLRSNSPTKLEATTRACQHGAETPAIVRVWWSTGAFATGITTTQTDKSRIPALRLSGPEFGNGSGPTLGTPRAAVLWSSVTSRAALQRVQRFAFPNHKSTGAETSMTRDMALARSCVLLGAGLTFARTYISGLRQVSVVQTRSHR